MLVDSEAAAPAVAARVAPSHGAQPESMLNPVPPKFDPHFAWQEEGKLEEHDADPSEGADGDAAADESTIGKFEPWTMTHAAARAHLIRLLDQHEEEERKKAMETGKQKITVTKRTKGIKLAMQSIISRDPEFGGGPRLLARPLRDAVESLRAITNAELASESVAASLAEQMTVTDRCIKEALKESTISKAKMEELRRAATDELRRAQMRELKFREYQEKQNTRDYYEGLLDDGLATLPESARAPPPQRDEDACAVGYMPSAEPASRFMAENPEQQDQYCVYVPEHETLRTQSFVDKELAERDKAKYEQEMGYAPKLREPRTRLAGAKIAAEALCRQCGAPDDALYRAEFAEEARLHDEKNTEAPELRRSRKGTMMQTLSEAFLAEHHRIHSLAESDEERAAAVHKALLKVVGEVVEVNPTQRAQKLCFCDNPRCIERAGRWPSWVKGCWLMKQRGCFNARAEVVRADCLPATALRKDRFGTQRYSTFYLLKNDLRVLRLLYALNMISDQDVLLMVQFVLHYSHWVAERERKALAMGHFMADNCKAFGFSLDHLDPNEFVDRCGELFVDFAVDVLHRLITGTKMPTFQAALVGKAARDEGVAPLTTSSASDPEALLTIEQVMRNFDTEMRLAFTINLPQPSDVAMRVRHWYVSSGTIRPLVNSDRALRTWASVVGMWEALTSLAKQSGNKNHGRYGEHIHILYERDDIETRSLEPVSIVPQEVAAKFGFDARETMRMMRRIAGADFERIQSSINVRMRPSVREQRTDRPRRGAGGRGDFHTTRTPTQCEQRQYLLSEALARRERAWGGRLHARNLEDAAIALQRTILHDPNADTGTSLTQRENEYCPPPHEPLQTALAAYAENRAAREQQEAEQRERDRAAAEREAALAREGDELLEDLQTEFDTLDAQNEHEKLNPVRDAIAKMDAAFHALLRPECVVGHSGCRLRWTGGVGDAGDEDFERLLEDSATLLPRAGGEDVAEPLLRAFLQALHDLHEFAGDYTTRWLQHVRDRGDKHVDEVVRPLTNCDPDRDALAVVAAAKLLQRLTASVANLDYYTKLMADADDGEVDQTQITATSIDPLGEILDNEPRLRRFGETLRQGNPVSYAEGGNAGYGLEHLTAYILEHCERFRQKAEHRDRAAALAATIPSTALVDLRLDYKGESLQWTDDTAATTARGALLAQFFERVVPYAARLHVATTWHTSLALTKLDADVAALQTDLDAARSEEPPDDAALRRRNAKQKKLQRHYERRSREREAKRNQHASELTKVARIVRELHVVVADAVQPLAPDASESESHIRSGSCPLLVAQLAHYEERVADDNKRHAQAWPLKPHAPVVEAPNELVQRTVEHLWALIRGAGTLTADNAFPDTPEHGQEKVVEMVDSVHGAYRADIEDLPTRTHAHKAPNELRQLAERLEARDDESEHGDGPSAEQTAQTDDRDLVDTRNSLAEILHRLRSDREDRAPAETEIRAPARGEMARVVADQQRRPSSKKRASNTDIDDLSDEDDDPRNMSQAEIEENERSIKRARYQAQQR